MVVGDNATPCIDPAIAAHEGGRYGRCGVTRGFIPRLEQPCGQVGLVPTLRIPLVPTPCVGMRRQNLRIKRSKSFWLRSIPKLELGNERLPKWL